MRSLDTAMSRAGVISALLLVGGTGLVVAETNEHDDWARSLRASYAHYEKQGLSTAKDGGPTLLPLGECPVRPMGPRSGRRRVAIEATPTFTLVLRSKYLAFPNLSIEVFDMVDPSELSVLASGCWDDNRPQVHLRRGSMLIRMVHTCRAKAYFAYDVADLVSAALAMAGPLDAIYVTPCGGKSAARPLEEIQEAASIARRVWKHVEPAHREGLKALATKTPR